MESLIDTNEMIKVSYLKQVAIKDATATTNMFKQVDFLFVSADLS